MNVEQFKRALENAGYEGISTRTMEPKGENAVHAHEFTAWGLVSEGEFIISRDGKAHGYKAGEEFQVPAGTLHTEAVGPDGACVTVGRKY